MSTTERTPTRADLYLRYRVEQGAFNRWGPGWESSERIERIDHELDTILTAGFSEYFLILASILDFCREREIPYGPGRGSVGGSVVAYLLGITEVDPLEWDLLFERFLNPDRVAYPDVDLDFSQIRRQEVLEFIRDTYERDGNVVLQVAAFARAGARSVIEQVLSAKRETDPSADSTATILRGCLPEGSITGGSKAKRELAAWLGGEGHGDRDKFREVAEQAGWLEPMLKLDSLYTHLQKHAAGVVILNQSDLLRLPQCSADGKHMMTGFDMYDLDELGYLKIDALGLRTLDVLADAHRFSGGSGRTEDLMEIWREHRDDAEPYKLLCDADTLGIFQMETDGYRRTLRDFQPYRFDHIVQLNALYRPGAIDYKLPDGRNMVQLFIDRHNLTELPDYPHHILEPILKETHGVILYQEQAMKIATDLAGFTMAEADALRKAIGKKRKSEMDKLEPLFREGCKREHAVPTPTINRIWENIEAAARYSWNKSHAVEYGVITWLTVWFKWHHPEAFYAALLNSYEGDKDRMADTIAEARQRVTITPPDVNVAQEGFTVANGEVVFGLLGVKGLGEDGRNRILVDRLVNGPYESFQQFAERLPSLPIDKKLALIRSGAFDRIDRREWLLATTRKPGKGKKCQTCNGEGGDPEGGGCHACGGTGRIPVDWTVAEHLNHNRTLKNPREVPPVFELQFPSDRDLTQGEADTVGFYVSTEPLADVAKALTRMPSGNHYGGEIERLYRKNDKRGEEMATITLLTPALTKRRVLVFASVWIKYRAWLKPGEQVIIRGKTDGDTIIANAFWSPDDMRHFKKVQLTKDDDVTIEPFDGESATVHHLEQRGYEVRLL